MEKVIYLAKNYHDLLERRVKSQLYLWLNYWQDQELTYWKNKFSWLPELYFKLIEKFDRLGLEWMNFFSFFAKRSRLLSKIDKNYFPFAKDAADSIHCFNNKQEVICFDINDYTYQNTQYIAQNLEELINQCLLGSRYAEFNYIEAAKFYQFLQSQGWT